MYVQYCAVCLKIDYTPRCLEYSCPESSPPRRLLTVKTLTNVLLTITYLKIKITFNQSKRLHTNILNV